MIALLVISILLLIALLIFLGITFYDYVETTYKYDFFSFEQILIFLLAAASFIMASLLYYKFGMSEKMFLNTLVTFTFAMILLAYQYVRISLKTKWYIGIGVMTIQLFVMFFGIVLIALGSGRYRCCDDYD